MGKKRITKILCVAAYAVLGDVSACLYAGGNIRQSSIDPSNLVLSFVGEKLNVPLYNGNVPPHPPTTHNGWCVRGGGAGMLHGRDVFI